MKYSKEYSFKTEIEKYVKERNEALFSLDKEKIKAFSEKWNIPFPQNETVFWAGIHKAIVHTTAATQEQRDNSIKWLIDHGFSLDIV